jgi:hypothetical protein
MTYGHIMTIGQNCQALMSRIVLLTEAKILIIYFSICACRITAITSAFQAEDVGSTPIGRFASSSFVVFYC